MVDRVEQTKYYKQLSEKTGVAFSDLVALDHNIELFNVGQAIAQHGADIEHAANLLSSALDYKFDQVACAISTLAQAVADLASQCEEKPIRLVAIEDLGAVFGLSISRQTLAEMERMGTFPKRFQVSKAKNSWHYKFDDVQAFIKRTLAERE